MRTTFGLAGNYRYKIEGSTDGNQWTLLADQTQTNSTEQVRTDVLPPDRHCQFVRLTFTGLPPGQTAAIAEVKIQGQHWP